MYYFKAKKNASTKNVSLATIEILIQIRKKSKEKYNRKVHNLAVYLLSKIRFSAFAAELARDSVNTFSLSTYLKTQKYCYG